MESQSVTSSYHDFLEELQELGPVMNGLLKANELEKEATTLAASFDLDVDSFFSNVQASGRDIEQEFQRIKELGRQALAPVDKRVELIEGAEDSLRRALNKLNETAVESKKKLESVNPGIADALERRVLGLDHDREELDEQLEHRELKPVTPPEIYETDSDKGTYCLCGKGSYGEMVACDAVKCPVEWFHFGCVGLTIAPIGKWYCDKCRAGAMRKRKRSRGQH